MQTITPVSFGCVGLGGYAKNIIDLLLSQTAESNPVLRLTAVCEPDLDAHSERVAQLRRLGVALHTNYDTFLAAPVEAVWLPLPIHLHRPYTEAALAAGKAVLCEKPAAGAIQDVDAMIAARNRARLPVALGFQDIYDPTITAAKQRLLAGELGGLKSAAVCVCWPRGSSYYKRSWAGALKRDGTWVLDSPANNAMAHYINLALFLLGPTENESAVPTAVEAELYRANSIETFDTCSLRITTTNGQTILVLLTHACETEVKPRVRINGKAGQLIVNEVEGVTFQIIGKADEVIARPNPRPPMARAFAAAVRGNRDVQLATLEMGRCHTLVVNGITEAAVPRAISAAHITIRRKGEDELRMIAGIEAAFDACYKQNRMLNESGLLAWTRPAGRRDLTNYKQFTGPAAD